MPVILGIFSRKTLPSCPKLSKSDIPINYLETVSKTVSKTVTRKKFLTIIVGHFQKRNFYNDCCKNIGECISCNRSFKCITYRNFGNNNYKCIEVAQIFKNLRYCVVSATSIAHCFCVKCVVTVTLVHSSHRTNILANSIVTLING